MLKLVEISRLGASNERRRDDLSALAEAARRGEPRAVRTFVTAIGPAVLRVVRRMVGPMHADVEDLTQEAMIQILAALPRYRGECSVLHFVYRIAMLASMNARRQYAAEKRSTLEYTDVELDGVPAPEPGPEATAATHRAVNLVRALLATLPEPQAEALALHCVLGYTVAEIAQSTGVAAETVRSRLRLAGQSLRPKLVDDRRLRERIEGAP
jgi:RNA polymerase sigma factor (sigma-70 family)